MSCVKGKVVAITGAGNGIGRSHALLFASHGARVVVNDPGCNRDGTGQGDAAELVAREIRAAGGEAVANTEVVGTLEAGERIARAAVDAFGRLDVLVNNAGILRDRTILKMTGAEWDSVLQVHLNGTFGCLKAAAAVMKEQGQGGRIINTSSISGLLGNFGQANYGAAKAGIHALTRIAAMELAKARITVNAIAPIAHTRMVADLPGGNAASTAETLGPQFISPLVVWLASDAAVGVTGQTFGIEGNHLFAYRMMTSHGTTKPHVSEPWKVEEIGSVMEQVLNW
jgi:NAD(P)-dependent dehydrogenase (short-subunit alcohol dehydrogenase family)